MLKIENFSKTYKNGVKAVDNLNLEIKAGDLCAFIGQNGAGKSTTLKAVCGILNFNEGNIFIDGNSILQKPVECKKIISFIPDNPDIYDYITGFQYLNFVAEIYGVSTEEKNKQISYYANLFELEKALGDLVSTYSHGMRQKLAIISALMHNPKLLIMDEPFVGLDPKASFTVKNILKQKCLEGCAVFFSTHVLEVAEKLCNKVAIIKGGKLQAFGEMDKVKGDKSLESLFLEV